MHPMGELFKPVVVVESKTWHRLTLLFDLEVEKGVRQKWQTISPTGRC